MTALKVLIVEDEQHLASALEMNLSMEGFEASVASTARDAARLLVEVGQFAVIILDVMLPDQDGITFCRQLRDAGNYTPVLMLTARGRPEDRVAGLEAGADDYLLKPFALAELLARLRSLIRRTRWSTADLPDPGDALRFGRADIDFGTMRAELDGAPLDLTRLEFDLLRCFSRSPNRVLSRAELLEDVWQVHGDSNTRTVDNFVLRLRRHFEPDPRNPVHFISVRGSGYRFVPDPPTT